MRRWWLWAAIAWALLFLAPPTRPLAVRFLPLGEAWDDLLVLLAVGILISANVTLAILRARERRQARALQRDEEIQRLEHELFDE